MYSPLGRGIRYQTKYTIMSSKKQNTKSQKPSQKANKQKQKKKPAKDKAPSVVAKFTRPGTCLGLKWPDGTGNATGTFIARTFVTVTSSAAGYFGIQVAAGRIRDQYRPAASFTTGTVTWGTYVDGKQYDSLAAISSLYRVVKSTVSVQPIVSLDKSKGFYDVLCTAGLSAPVRADDLVAEHEMFTLSGGPLVVMPKPMDGSVRSFRAITNLDEWDNEYGMVTIIGSGAEASTPVLRVEIQLHIEYTAKYNTAGEAAVTPAAARDGGLLSSITNAIAGNNVFLAGAFSYAAGAIAGGASQVAQHIPYRAWGGGQY